MDQRPLISVIMPICNGGSFLRAAIDSVLAQTCADFEMLVIDNGSTDASIDIARSYTDPRIIVLHEPQRGLVPPLRKGLSKARGNFIARMDADDISTPERLMKQVRYLEMHPDVVLVGTWAQVINAEGAVTGQDYTPPASSSELCRTLCQENVIVHGSIMMRIEAARAVGGYRSNFAYAEDYDLWLRLAEIGQLANIPEPLYQWRRHDQSTTHTTTHKTVYDCANRARRNALNRYLKASMHYNGRNHTISHGQSGWDALTLNEWTMPYLSEPRLCIVDYLLARAILSEPRNTYTWLLIRHRYMSRAAVRVLLRVARNRLRSHGCAQRRVLNKIFGITYDTLRDKIPSLSLKRSISNRELKFDVLLHRIVCSCI